MLRIWITTMSLGLVLVIGGGPVWAEVIAYPKKGQTQEQFEKDQFDCHKWAKGQTGVDPTQAPQAAAPPPPQKGGAVRGAARGAAVGAAAGAVAGDAGKGAAIGAAAGGTGGAIKQGQQNKQAAQAQQQAARSQYDKAYAVCLEGKGYAVK